MDKLTRYRVRGYGDIAWQYVGPEIVREEICTAVDDDDDYGPYSFCEEYEYESGMVRMVMVGDDREFMIDPEDCDVLSDDEYCPECGQIGCMAYQ